DILFFVQLEAERVPLRREEVRTAALIEAVMADLPPPAERARVPLRVAIAAEAASLRIDEALVRRLLFHLLSNAFKFTSEGEVTVESQPGAGSEFRVRIPDALVVAHADEQPAAAARLLH